MNRIFTNDLLRLAYHETNSSETLNIIEAIENDWETKETYQSLTRMQKSLNSLQRNPSDASIDFILNYSRRQKVTS